MSVIIAVIVVDHVVVVIAIAIVIVAAVLLCSVLLSLGVNNYFCCFGNLTNIPNNASSGSNGGQPNNGMHTHPPRQRYCQ